jgi:type IV pilus assembly protein PilB
LGFKAVRSPTRQIDRLIAKYSCAAEEHRRRSWELRMIHPRPEEPGESIDLKPHEGLSQSGTKLINLVLLQAIKDKASDIHFEPFEDEFKLRYRIDGVLYEMMPPPSHIGPPSAPYKVMATSISPSAMPQDGASS